ncbi:MAG: hypothetical protein ISR85_06410 [Kiritimatiellales bacterium]|nr:hypothetical protein [Kiritimatiellota bacterium]MBL7012543.1 hypothetical protein [Kiritimatiellales bacterium]
MTRKIMFFSLLTLLLAGCTALEQRSAWVSDGTIENPALGFFGFSYDIPDGVTLYHPARISLAECTEIQKMAIRIYNQNRAYHPSGNETFYESFLMFSESAAFLLITVKEDRFVEMDMSWLEDEVATQYPLMPLYNVRTVRQTRLGGARLEATLSTGTAYEKKGWYYDHPKGSRMSFSYEACKVSGVNRDNYILMGFSLPEHEHILSIQMQEMIGGFDF